MRGVGRVVATTIVAGLFFTGLMAQADSWPKAVAEALRLREAGNIAGAADMLRKTRQSYPNLPAVHVLQLIQYLTEQATAVPPPPRAQAGRLLDEATALADELIKIKQEVRMAMLAKSAVLKLKAEQVEQNAERKKSLLAQSDRVYDEARFVRADGSAIARTVEDDWRDAQAKAIVELSDGRRKEDAAVYEKFIAAHPEYAPARLALGRSLQQQADEITDRTPKSVATRTRLLELAASHYRRVVDGATDPIDAVFALDALIDTLDTRNLNRPAEAEALARQAVAKYPDHPMLVMRLLKLLLPTARAATTGNALQNARALVPAKAESRHVYAMILWELVYRSPESLSRDTTKLLLAEAITALDSALKLKPDFVEALMYKSVVLKMQAERVEQDPARIKTLIAEAERLAEQAKRLMNRKTASTGAHLYRWIDAHC